MKFSKLKLLSMVAIVSLCQTDQVFAAERRSTELHGEDFIKFAKNPTEIRKLVDAALLKDPHDFHLNFLSGLVYEASSTAGSEGRELARVGYIASLREDPTYWPANFQLGLLALEDKDPISAERFFLAAAFFAPDNAQIFYALARAAYCAGDLANAAPALMRAIALSPPTKVDELVTAALVSAATGDQTGTQKWLDALSTSGKPESFGYLQRRVRDLLSPTSTTQGIPAAASPTTPAPATALRRKMAIVDVVIIRRIESQSNSSGINLMDALSLQFGSTLINSQRSRTYDRQAGAGISDTVTTINDLNLAVPAITYSLNIANAGGSNSSIEARPTILVYDGQTSKLFSGGTLTYAASGEYTTQSFTKEVGLTLSVTPKFNDADTVTLNISTGLETFLTKTAVGSFEESLQTDKASTDVTAELRLGDTIVVSAGRSTRVQTSKSGTPVIQDVPLLGSLFKKRSNSFDTSDLLILLSVRRDIGGSETGSVAERQIASVQGNQLWRKLGIAQSDSVINKDSEVRYEYYSLDNPGRGFSKLYLNEIGITDDIIIN
jgi:hypothetical protein